MALVLNSTTEFTGKDIATNPIDNAANLLLTYTATEDHKIKIRVDLGKTGGLLDGAAANFDLLVRLTRDGADVDVYYEATIAKRTATDTRWSYTLTRPIVIQDGEVLKLYAKSSNANDTDVDGDVFVTDSSARNEDVHTWYVAKDGIDDRGGHSRAGALLTIGAAVAAASNGDKIIVYPGTYAETLDLSAMADVILKGFSWGTKVIASVAGNLITLGSRCTLENMYVENTNAAAVAVGADTESCITIRHCYLDGVDTVKFLDTDNVIISDCIIVGTEYGICLKGTAAGETYKATIDNCMIMTSTWTTCFSAALFIEDMLCIVRDTHLCPNMPSAEASKQCAGIQINGAANPTSLIAERCVFWPTATAGAYLVGVTMSGQYATALMHNCDINLPPLKGLAFSTENDARITTKNCNYDRARVWGDVTDEDAIVNKLWLDDYDQHVTDSGCDAPGEWTCGDSWSITSSHAQCAMPGAESILSQDITLVQGRTYRLQFESSLFFSGSITPKVGGTAGTAFDEVGYYTEEIVAGATDKIEFVADSGTLAYVDNITLYDVTEGERSKVDIDQTIAAKILKNKAVQTKASGVIQYYDDDGVTPILTHTPTDGESTITRTPS